ncbi:GrpB family protein [Staphylococcus gallinarum]|uniref:GrpB family protein n=1 Tax=Staphylococcus TaxID=1279 RepID=UPI000D1EB4D8|nr:GrpB family protein [Staphylococcus gallinarum]MCD8820813.1 GrpB family protein [Staphylococcus gallinarum]PTL07826.1 hypothetical protein BUZ09_07365 [Staphylococcus gallinarum]PTL09598.1 hypothetical protein BUZ15_07300 [Staphylococcus gallinarum]RIL35456.1 GrpB family protein [Staphylococcus gallinarum]RIO78146.1 GrpB family protein [Staphylococcus gallinarum]
MRTIEVMPYDVAWKEAFSREQVQLAKLFNNEVVDIYHIGSTSVPNLYAKPIIDILVVVNNIKAVDHYNPEMFELGYAAKAENGIKNRRFFIKGGDQRTHHVHVFPKSERAQIERHLAVRDYLLAYDNMVEHYGELKRKLAKSFRFDSEGYCQSKDAYMKRLESMALQWYNNKNKHQ